MNNLKIFQNENFGQVRTIEEDGKVLFCGSDVAKSLGYARPNDAVNSHCRATVKRSTPISGKMQEINFITEGDLYRLITNSKLPTAEKFESWVFDEVLPTIRKTGTYSKPISKELQAIIMIDQKQQVIESRVESLENNMTVDYGQQRNLQNMARSRVVKCIGGMDKPVYSNKSIRGKVFESIWRDFKDYFNISSYRNTPRTEYQKAMDFIGEWKPQGKLLREIEDCNSQICIPA